MKAFNSNQYFSKKVSLNVLYSVSHSLPNPEFL